MHQYGWLDLFGGRWLFLDQSFRYPARSWSDKREALAQLQEEGWTIAGPHPRRLSMIRKRRINGYAMKRTVH